MNPDVERLRAMMPRDPIDPSDVKIGDRVRFRAAIRAEHGERAMNPDAERAMNPDAERLRAMAVYRVFKDLEDRVKRDGFLPWAAEHVLDELAKAEQEATT